MTLFRSELSDPSPVETEKTCPNWSSDTIRIKKLKECFDILDSSTFPELKKYVFDYGRGTANDNIRIDGSPLTLHVPTLGVTRDNINIFLLSQVTTIYAIYYINEIIKDAVLNNKNISGDIFDILKKKFLSESGSTGFTSDSYLKEILQEDLPLKDRVEKISSIISDSSKYIYKGPAGDSPLSDPSKLYYSIMNVLNSEIKYESQCLFQHLLREYTPPDMITLAVGDGETGTMGLFGRSNVLDGNRALVLFNYTVLMGSTISASGVTTKTLPKTGNNKKTVVHFTVYGMDFYDQDKPDTAATPRNPNSSYREKVMRIKVTDDKTKKFVILNVINSSSKFELILFAPASTTDFQIKGFKTTGPTKNSYIVINDVSDGTFTVEISAAVRNPGGGGITFDETVVIINSIQDKEFSYNIDLDSDNQYRDDRFALDHGDKFDLTGAWKIWNSTDELNNLDGLIKELKGDAKSILTTLNGKYIGKRAIPYSTAYTYSKGDLVYHNLSTGPLFSNNHIYEYIKNTAGNSAISNNAFWKIKYEVYNPTKTYALNEIVVIPVSPQSGSLSTKFQLFKALKRGITGLFDSKQWLKISVVTSETDVNKFETGAPTTPYQTIYYPSLRYSFANVLITDTSVNFVIDSYVSPVRSRLDEKFLDPTIGNKTLPLVNNFNHLFTTAFKEAPLNTFTLVPSELNIASGVDPGLNTVTPGPGSNKIPIYNLTLSYLRSFGFWEALVERIIARANDPLCSVVLTPSEIAAITLKLNTALVNTKLKIPTERKDKTIITKTRFFNKTNWDNYKF